MAILQAIILGIIEGLTEFLPISSTGHLIVSQQLMGYKDVAELFAVVVQVGAIAAVIWHYKNDLIKRTVGLFERKPRSIHFWRNWVVATIPAGLAGLALESALGAAAVPLVIGITLILGGLGILVVERSVKVKPSRSEESIAELTTTQSVKIGLFQVLALVPGVSRSGATIMGGLLTGVDRVTATAFSFYLSIPIIVLASGYKLVSGWDEIPQISGGGIALVAGLITSFVTALIAINWLLKYVAHHDFKPFAYYRLGLGLLILIAVVAGIL
ncbi:undecaprenyl-diphosphate phosphatase [Candidatus Saccharibacteria bacterium]|nr:undecaprenyl-diphosphate phosphatase [Candidatus Saccharibacteria bacterium]